MPPLGDLRWRAPQPPNAWSGCFKALSFGPKPAQIAGSAGGFSSRLHGQPAGDEDCLHLNVWSPYFSPEDVPKGENKLPVMVWIYGGGNATGASDIPLYNLASLAQKHNIIGVSMNYRVGVFGWFSHPSLYDQDTTEKDRSGNFGTLDIIQALKWIQNNIDVFGGDPNNVTIMGESAGAINVYSMLLSPLAKGLFHRAIAQSAVLTPYTIAESQNFIDDSEPGHRGSSAEVINNLLIKQGQAKNRDEAKQLQLNMSSTELRQLLYEQSADQLLDTFQEQVMGMYQSPRPIGDGFVLPPEPWFDVFCNPDQWNQVPLITGSNLDEYKLFMASDTEDYVNLRFGFIPQPRDWDGFNLDARYYSSLWKACAVDEPATRLSTSPNSSIYAYRFDWKDWPKLPGVNLPKLIGASHGIDVFFVLDTFSKKPWLKWLLGFQRYAAIIQLSNDIQSYWVEFARTGSPGCGTNSQLPKWPKWDDDDTVTGQFQILNIQKEEGIKISTDVITVAGLKGQLITDPALKNNELAQMRMYARLFIYGPHGTYWDKQTFEPLAAYAPKGVQRAAVEAYLPARLP